MTATAATADLRSQWLELNDACVEADLSVGYEPMGSRSYWAARKRRDAAEAAMEAFRAAHPEVETALRAEQHEARSATARRVIEGGF